MVRLFMLEKCLTDYVIFLGAFGLLCVYFKMTISFIKRNIQDFFGKWAFDTWPAYKADNRQ